jgi:hypothetical protein
MIIFIGFAAFLALVVALLLWMSHRTFKPGGAGHDVIGTARQAKLQAKEHVTKWSAGA